MNRSGNDRQQTDPLVWCVAIALVFFLISLLRIDTPSRAFFDEGFYLTAAFKLLTGAELSNREHPMLGKEILAASMALFGNNPVAWRIPSLFMMPVGIFFAMRTLWRLSNDAIATVLFGFFLATSCLLNVFGRAATLDAPMIFFAALAAYFFVRDQTARSPAWRIASAIAFGLSLACKWTIAPLLPIIALAWAIERGPSVATLVKAGLWFGVLPLAVYFLTFAPGFFVADNPLRLDQIVPLQLAMAKAIAGYEGPSAYPSVWWEWLFNLAPYWGLADQVDGAWRFIILIGNPVSTLLVLPAVACSLWLVVRRRERALVWPLLFYSVPLILAATSSRLQFVHHYTIPLIVGLSLLSLMLARLWHAGAKWPVWSVAIASTAGFIWLFPSITAAPFPSEQSGARFVPIPRWQYVDWNEWAKVHRAKPRPNWVRLQSCLEDAERPGC